MPNSLAPRRGHLRSRDWRRVSHGLYTPAGPSVETPPTERHRLVRDLSAWALVLPPSGCFTHLTAAAAYGWHLPQVPHDLPVFAAMHEEETRPKRKGLRVSRHPTAPLRSHRHGIPLAHPAEALLASARDLVMLDLALLVDSALHHGDCTVDQLRHAARSRRRGAPALRRVLPHVDARAESPWETVLRIFHQVCDVPVVPQHLLLDAGGRVIARGDLWIVGTCVLHEYDGGVHRDPRQHRHDLARERAIGNQGWVRRGYTSQDLLGRAHLILREADAALGRRHDPRRLDAWHAALRHSSFTATGRARLRRRWKLPPA